MSDRKFHTTVSTTVSSDLFDKLDGQIRDFCPGTSLSSILRTALELLVDKVGLEKITRFGRLDQDKVERLQISNSEVDRITGAGKPIFRCTLDTSGENDDDLEKRKELLSMDKHDLEGAIADNFGYRVKIDGDRLIVDGPDADFVGFVVKFGTTVHGEVSETRPLDADECYNY